MQSVPGLRKVQPSCFFRDQNTTLQEKFTGDSHIKIPEAEFCYIIVVILIVFKQTLDIYTFH